MSRILYNNVDIISDQPSPLVSRAVQPYFAGDGQKIGQTEVYQLNGQITGCNFFTITGAMNRLTSAFCKDFFDLKMVDDDGYTVTVGGCKVNNISFAQGTEVGLQEYTVELESRPASAFKNAGIIEKRNNWSVSQGDDGNFAISHEIYAKGINTSAGYDNALDNAKTFVQSLTGFAMPPLFPFFITGFSGSLDTRSENINRLEATYGINEQYIGNTGKVTKTISVELTSGTDGIITVGVNGNFRVGKAEDFPLLRTEYSGFDSYGAATGAYDTYRGVSGLLPLPLSSGVSESYIDNSLTFDVSFNDWPTTTYRHDYQVSVTSGTDGIITASIDGNIQGLGKQNVRYDNAYNFYKTLNIFNITNDEYLLYVGNSYTHSLNPYPVASGTTTDRFEGLIGYNASWTDKDLAMSGSGIKAFSVTFSKTYPMRQVSPVSIINSISGLDTMDLSWNSRGNLAVNGNVVVDKPRTSVDATGYAAQYINIHYLSGVLCNDLCSTNKTKIRLDSANMTQNINKDSCDFSASHSFDEPLPTNPAASYTLITTLRL